MRRMSRKRSTIASCPTLARLTQVGEALLRPAVPRLGVRGLGCCSCCCFLLLVCLPPSTAVALGPDGAPIDTSDYTIDFYEGPVLHSSRVIGLGGSIAPL